MGNCIHRAQKQPVSAHDVAAWCENVRPLDLIVFGGNVEAVFDLFNLGDTRITHVELAITQDWCNRIKPLKTAIDESFEMFSWAMTKSDTANSTQIRPLKELVTQYLQAGGFVGVYRLISNPTERRAGESNESFALRTKDIQRQLARAFDKYVTQSTKVPFPADMALFPADWLFCGELVATVYSECEIFTKNADKILESPIWISNKWR